MSVYIEFVILDNLIINYIIFYLANRKCKWYRVLLASAIATVCSVLYPFYMDMHFVIVLAIKIVLSALCALIIGGVRLRAYFISLAMIYVYTFLLGGICFGILYLLGDVDFFAGGLMYSVKVPIGVVIGGVFMLLVAAKMIVAHIKRNKTLHNLTCEVEIVVGDRMVRVGGMIDTGNMLRDPDSGQKVIVVDRSILFDFISDSSGKIKTEKLPNGHYIDCNTISDVNKKIFLFKPYKLLLYFKDNVHKIDNMMIGFSAVDNAFSKDIKALVPYID